MTEGILCQAAGCWIFLFLCSAYLFPANVTISVFPLCPVFILFEPHIVLESENSSAGMVCLTFFLPSTRDPSVRGDLGSVPCE